MTVLCLHILACGQAARMQRTMDTRSTRTEQHQSRLLMLKRLHGHMLLMVSSKRPPLLTLISLPQTVQQLTKRLHKLRVQLYGLLTQK